MTKAEIKNYQRALTKIWLDAIGGVHPPRERIVLNLTPRRRGVVYPNRARRWGSVEPMRLKTLY